MASCSVVKDYPSRTPFVYETNINIENKLTTDEKKNLTGQLQDQLHDSIRVRLIQKLIGWDKGPKVLYSVLQNPPVYDSIYAGQSMVFMKALLNAQGYYRDSIYYNTKIDSVGDQYRTTVNFNVNAGKLFRLDSIGYKIGADNINNNIESDDLERITTEAKQQSLLKKGGAFSKPLLSAERDRITDVFRNNGYLRFSQDEILVIWDTLGRALLRPTLDPIEQAQQLDALRRRRENPIADVEFILRTNIDTSHLVKYHVGNVTIYPDLNQDTSSYQPIVRTRRDFTIISYRDLYRPRVVTENVYLRRGDVYSQRNYLRTLNRFNSIGSWRLVSIDQIPRAGTDTVDFNIKLTPAPKYIFDANLESSQNWGSPFTEGTLIGVNFNLQNRNFAKGANQANTSIRLGTDLNPDTLLQTRQISIGHVINFPRLIPRLGFPLMLRENTRTSLAFNGNYINREKFFNLTNINASWGYDFNWKNKLLSIRLPNIEFTRLQAKEDLLKLIEQNQSYRYIFNDGLVISTIASLSRTGNKSLSFRKNNPNNKINLINYMRVNAEGSGLLSGFIHSERLDRYLYRFIKIDGDIRQTYQIRRTAFAWRFFSGVGYEIINPRNPEQKYLPFFKSYFAGGPNSMRGWQLRRLGPGSTKKSFARNIAPDRFGDIQLELNGEYRFFVADIKGVLLNSALFTDIGNIWFLRKNPDFLNGEFKLSRLGEDIAIAAGTGLRVDFGPFLVRVDYGYRVKNPNVEKQWFNSLKLSNGQIQIGVTYPF
jgi:outer membrane protein assembly factor BamA